ncbi:MAG: hypothetical protein ACREXY_10285 [Gammaproteobacteria bacterium]
MFAPALRIALAKPDCTASHDALSRALLDAEALARIESEFESKINASKARRGEKPTHLSKARRAQVGQYAADAESLHAEQLAAFETGMSAAEILAALKSGLDSDLQFWSTAAKHTHPDDLALVEEFVNAKRALQASLALCLTGPSAGAA